MQIEPSSDERIIITGQTGSGKTFLARQLLEGVKRLVVLDPKGMLRSPGEDDAEYGDIENWKLREWSDDTEELLATGKPVRVRIPAPIDGKWDEQLWVIYRSGNCVLYIDEIYGVVPPGRRPPEPLNAIYTRGRELGIGAVGVSQRPAWIPLELMSEPEWYFCFRLMLETDRRRMAEFMGMEVISRITDRYGFWTYNVHWDEPIYTEQLEVEVPRSRRREKSA